MIVHDHIGRKVQLQPPVRRIASLVPSLTELLCDMGLQDRLVAATRYCVHPQGITQQVAVIGGTKDVKAQQLHDLKPDLVLANREENTPRTIRSIEAQLPTYVTQITDLGGITSLTSFLGRCCGVEQRAAQVSEAIVKAWRNIAAAASAHRARSGLYLIWKNPYMAAGTDTFISWAMQQCGIHNVLAQRGREGRRYPRLSLLEIEKLAPESILLSSEPYPFTESHRFEFPFMQPGSVCCCDGEAFSWYGSRIVHVQSQVLDFLKREVFA